MGAGRRQPRTGCRRRSARGVATPRRARPVGASRRAGADHARAPASARRRAGSVLAYAVEDEDRRRAGCQPGELARFRRRRRCARGGGQKGLKRWRDALGAAGIHGSEVHCETLLLPWVAGEWSLAWDGREGFVRTGEFEGAATDCGDRAAPPLSLRLMLDEAQARSERPDIDCALYYGARRGAGSRRMAA